MTKDEKTIREIKNGKIESFSYIVRAYTVKITQFVSSRIFNKEDWDDIVQNSFIKFYRSIGSFDESLPVLPYLYQITRNELKMYYRSRKETIALHDDVSMVNSNDLYKQGDDVDEIIKTLSSEKKKVMKLLSDGYSYKEIADKLKKPINSVRTLIRRARLQLIQTKSYESS